MKIPREHHRFILGKSGKKLQELELATATKIFLPRPEENLDIIRIVGTKDGIDKARHEIQCTSDEQVCNNEFLSQVVYVHHRWFRYFGTVISQLFLVL